MPQTFQVLRVRGFTLTELTIVMVVLGLLAGMAVTSMSGLQGSRQDVAATRIRTTLAYTQEWAQGSSNDTWVAFDVSNDRVSAFVEDPNNPGKAGRFPLTDPLTRSALTLQLGTDGVGLVSVSIGGTGEVQFKTSGVPFNENGIALTADGTIGVTGGGVVRITKNTGLVSID